MKLVPDKKLFMARIEGAIERHEMEIITLSDGRGHYMNIPEMTITNMCAREMRVRIDRLYDILFNLDVICIKYFGESAWKLHQNDVKTAVEFLIAAWERNIDFDVPELIKQIGEERGV
jgi:hypothetical protein